jgi:hypothetical protein
MKNVLKQGLDECVSPTNIAMHDSLNFQELHKGYWGVIRLLGVFIDFMLQCEMMGVHGCMGGFFCFGI